MRLTLHSKAAESVRYRPDIDGLRAVAVLSVVLYHAGIKGFPGGYVGVDIFFVISGYLITRVLEDEMKDGRFSIFGFYERRIRRIFPALFTLAAVCCALALALFPPQQIVEFGRSLLAMSGFVSNVYFKSTSHGAGYFAEASGAQLLLHTWSLSVEEQFYVGFPAFPVFDKMLPDYETRVATLGRLGEAGGAPVDETPFDFRDALRRLAIGAGATVFDPRDTLCPGGGVCRVQAGGVSLYSNYSHVAGSQVGIMEPGLKKVLADASGPSSVGAR